MSEKNDHSNVTSVAKALRILDTYTHEKPMQRVGEIARQLGFPVSTTSRLIQTLVEEGFLNRSDSSSGYVLGPKILRLGGLFISRSKIYHEVSPLLNRLVVDLGETTHIAFLDGYEVVYLSKQLGPYYVTLESDVGLRNPAYTTSSGKVLLSDKDESFVKLMFEGNIKKYAKHTITKYDDFKVELDKVRQRGYASSISEMSEENFSFAVPVKDENGKIVCAITVVAPISRRSPKEREEKFIKILVEAGEMASERLAYAEDGYI